ncbi:hypothetical protein [Amaricoccus solimangrovi]|uniref:Uncharacterized protein n=1 Tax=Amaricoccus solimangrovi TaxID=2589815 RepID=A0A501WZM2_9RHOB|nr:hypothetical protein [Amaricoccus solimangrovi]TPE53227.1 hypothetical protein FJM51_04195 [Amaricoccus solimangrovi]
MPKFVTKGVGLMQRTVVQYNPEDDPEAFRPGGEIEVAFSKCRTADGYRDEKAENMRKSLAAAYSKMDPAWFCRKAPQHTEGTRADMALRPAFYVRAYYGENHAYAIMQQWLDRYDELAAERGEAEPNLARLIELGEELGRLHERIFWRAGVDRDTGQIRETLALREKKAVSDRRAGGATNAAKAERWQAIARRLAAEIRSRRSKPASMLELANAIHQRWPDNEDSPPSVRTLRNWLAKSDA